MSINCPCCPVIAPVPNSPTPYTSSKTRPVAAILYIDAVPNATTSITDVSATAIAVSRVQPNIAAAIYFAPSQDCQEK